MNIDYLFTLKPDSPEFEAERTRLITAAMLEVPEKHRAACETLQAELDRVRQTMSMEDFMIFVSKRLEENLDNLQDQVNALQTLIEKDTVDKPRLGKIQTAIVS